MGLNFAGMMATFAKDTREKGLIQFPGEEWQAQRYGTGVFAWYHSFNAVGSPEGNKKESSRVCSYHWMISWG